MPWDEIIEGLLKQVRLQTGWLRLRPLFSRILDGCYCVRNNRIGEMSCKSGDLDIRIPDHMYYKLPPLFIKLEHTPLT